MAHTQFARLTPTQVSELARHPDADALVGAYLVTQRLPWHLEHAPTLADLASACGRSTRRIAPIATAMAGIGAFTRTRPTSRDCYSYGTTDAWGEPEGEKFRRLPDEWVRAVADRRVSVADLGRVAVTAVIAVRSWFTWETTRQFVVKSTEASAAAGCSAEAIQRSIAAFVRAGLLERHGHTVRVPDAIQERTWGNTKAAPASVRPGHQSRTSVRSSRAGSNARACTAFGGTGLEKAQYGEKPAAPTAKGASPHRSGRAKPALPPIDPMAQDVLNRAGLATKAFRTEAERNLWGSLAIQVVTTGRRRRSRPEAVVAALVKVATPPGRDAVVWQGLLRGTRVRFDDCDRRLVTCACGVVYGAGDLFGSGRCPQCGLGEGEEIDREAAAEHERRVHEMHAAWVASGHVRGARSAREIILGTTEPTGDQRRHEMIAFVSRCDAGSIGRCCGPDGIDQEAIDRLLASYEPRVAWDEHEQVYRWREDVARRASA